MSLMAAPMPENEERRVQVVQNTGIIDTNQGDLFRVYCEIAKDLLDYDAAIFSLFDSEDQCHIAKIGMPNEDPDTKGKRNTSLCAYVLLETEPLLIPNICEHEVPQTPIGMMRTSIYPRLLIRPILTCRLLRGANRRS